MSKSVAQQLAELERMTASPLREKYTEVFGEQSRSNNKDWLIKRIAWRIQANLEGGLSERAKRRAEELANDADLRLKAPRTLKLAIEPQPIQRQATRSVPQPTDNRLPSVGTVIMRDYKGAQLKVKVRTDGLEYEGELYATLSAVAKAVTGTHTNGYLFFKLGQYKDGGAK
jgi:hypothetical protein